MIERLYPTPVYYDIIKNSQVINYHIDKVIDKVDFQMNDNWGMTHYLSTDFMKGRRSNIIKDLGLHKIKKEIHNHLREYCNELEFEMREYEVESWFSSLRKEIMLIFIIMEKVIYLGCITIPQMEMMEIYF